MNYYISSNDYYGALNRRFDARMKKLARMSKHLNFYYNKELKAWVKYGYTNAKIWLTRTHVMYMPNRVFYNELTAII